METTISGFGFRVGYIGGHIRVTYWDDGNQDGKLLGV